MGTESAISLADPWLCRPGYLDLIDGAGAGHPEGQGGLTGTERDTYRTDFDAAATTIAGGQDVHFGQTDAFAKRRRSAAIRESQRVGHTRSSVMIEKMLGQSLDSLSAQLHTPGTALLQMQQPDNDAGCAAGALATLPTEMTEVKVTNGGELRRLRLGSCPDSWGVWFADDWRQTPWKRFLDELADAGYRWLELGPYGYLPTDPSRLSDELAQRSLWVAGGTMHGLSGLHRPNDFGAIAAQTRRVAALTQAVGGKHLIFVPVPGYRDDVTGAYLAPAVLGRGEWRAMIDAVDRLGRIVAEEYGLTLQFHPHADYHVETQEQTEQFLDDTDPRFVSLCLDTGHLAYRGADVPALIRNYPDRIGYVHIKQMDPAIVAVAERDDLAFGQAVAMGASCAPPAGVPDIPSVLEALRVIEADLFVVVEQDMYPVDFDVPLPIATNTRIYLNSCGLESVAPTAADNASSSSQ